MVLVQDSKVHCELELGEYKTVEVRSIFEIADANTIRFQNFERRQGKALKTEDFGLGRLKRNSSLLRPVSPCAMDLAFEFPMGLYFPEDNFDDHKTCQNIHEGPVEDLFDIFDSDPETGLHTAQVNINSKIYGPNVTQIPTDSPPSLYWVFLQNIFRPLTWIIWICSILSGTSYAVQLWTNHHMYSIIDNAIACACLMAVALLSTVLGFLHERSTRRQLFALKEKTPRTTTVLRNSRKRQVPNAEIVVGDIIEVRTGDIIPADIRIIDSDGLKVDEAMIKGESKPRTHNTECTHENPLETGNLAFASTLVVEGTATGIVIATGNKTTSGSFVEMAAKIHSKTSVLTREIRTLLEFFTLATLAFILVDVSCSILLQKAPIHIFVDSINIIITFMPYSASIGMMTLFWRTSRRFANNSLIVKNPDALRSLGLTNVLCVDKTGTITKHHLTVTHLYVNNEILENTISEDQPDFEAEEVLEAICSTGFQALETVAILCNSAHYVIGEGQNCFQKRFLDGDYIDKALIQYFEMYRTDTEYLRDQYQLIYDQKFNSKRKFQACLYKKKPNPLSTWKFDSFIFVMKGAPEAILKYCTSILVKGQEYPLTEEWVWEIKKAQKYLTSVGEIVVGFCDLKFKDMASRSSREPDYGQSEFSFHNMLRRGLRFVGLISMFDPPRQGVREAIRKCKKAGIKIIMLTGDHADTSKAIAQSVGILSQGPREAFPKREKVDFGLGSSNFRFKAEDKFQSSSRSGGSSIIYHGIQLYSLSELDLQMDIRTYPEIIFARLSPQQKFSIVKTLQDMGYVVTMVGDGINDTPALKQADLGVAIGIETSNSSTNQVQDFSDIIIKDGNFYGLVEGMELSRSCAAVLKRIFFYCMADTLPFVVALLSFSILRIPMAISLVMVLVVRIGIDMMAVLLIPSDLNNFNCWKNENENGENGGPVKDSICSHSLISFTYGQIGMVETLAGFATYFIIYAQNGFLPLKLLGLERIWNADQVNDVVDSYGQEWPYENRKELEMVGCLGFFMAVAVCQCANLFVCQSRINGPFWKRSIRSYPLTITSFLMIAVTAFFVYIPFLVLPSHRHTVFFRFDWWFISIPFFLFIIIYDESRHHFLSSPVFKSEFTF